MAETLTHVARPAATRELADLVTKGVPATWKGAGQLLYPGKDHNGISMRQF
jgi:hypothetical protein